MEVKMEVTVELKMDNTFGDYKTFVKYKSLVKASNRTGHER